MKSTMLKIIVKQFFENKCGFELKDSTLDILIKELIKEDKSIEATVSRIHYESKNDAEAKEVRRPKVTSSLISNPEPKEESDWISVNDRMPEESVLKVSKDILTCNNEGECNVDYTCNGIFKRFYHYGLNNNITHWRLLPKLPKKQ